MAYSPKLHFTQDLVDLWYEMFSECEEEGLKLAVNKCIQENEFAPNIAALMKCYKELEQEKIELTDTISHQYTSIRAIWGEEWDSATFNAIVTYIFRFPKKQRKVEMIELAQRAISYYHNCDSAGRKERPTIKGYVEGER